MKLLRRRLSDDNGPWNDLAENATGELSLSAAGTLKTDWLKIDKEAQKEDMIIRVMCKGGDSAHTTVFYGVTVQIR